MTNKGPEDGWGFDASNGRVSSTESAITGVKWTRTKEDGREGIGEWCMLQWYYFPSLGFEMT